MTPRPARGPDSPSLRIGSLPELLLAVPYLLGFHPRDSLVLVGLHGGTVVVTARLDLAGLVPDDAAAAEQLAGTLAAIAHGGATALVVAVCPEAPDGSACLAPWPGRAASTGPAGAAPLPVAAWAPLAARIAAAAGTAGLQAREVCLAVGGRWVAYGCDCGACRSGEGTALPQDSTLAARATYAGLVALPDRDDLERLLVPEAGRDRRREAVRTEEQRAITAILAGGAARQDRSDVRALFAAARAVDAPGDGAGAAATPRPDDGAVVRFGVALRRLAVRDPVWLAVDDGRLDGRPLWRALAAALPAPYDATPLLLFAWRTWRGGDGALAGIAAGRALESDPHCSAADLLLSALARGVPPGQLPRLSRRQHREPA